MRENCLCVETLINVNHIVVPKCLLAEYIEFSAHLDAALCRRYGRYYICDQVNQLRCDATQFYVEAFYRDIPGLCEITPEISEFITDCYERKFGDRVKRESVTGYMSVRKVYPHCDAHVQI